MRKPVFDALRAALGGSLTQDQVKTMDDTLDRLGVPREALTGHRTINADGLKLIKESEGLELKAYKDPIGVLTIGYGSTGPHVKPGMVITEAQAEDLLRKDLSRFEVGVADMCKVATSNQFSAMVSLAFNVGLENFRTSTLRRKHNEGDYAGAAAEFAKWRFADGRELPGLVKRRAREAQLYRSAA